MWWVVLFALAACNQVYGLDPTDLAGAKQCSTVRFSEGRALDEFSNIGFVFDGQLSASGTELWYTQPNSDSYDLFRATRPDRQSAFQIPTVPTTLLVGSSTFDPAMNGEGTRMMFLTSDTNRLYEAVREDPASPTFDSVRTVAGLGDFPGGLESIDLAWDGLTLYFTANGGVLYVAHRDALDAPFDGSTMLFEGVAFPTVSPDEKEIFYAKYQMGSYGQVFRQTRDDRDGDFANEEIVFDDASDPDISPDAGTLVLSTRSGLSLLGRACP